MQHQRELLECFRPFSSLDYTKLPGSPCTAGALGQSRAAELYRLGKLRNSSAKQRQEVAKTRPYSIYSVQSPRTVMGSLCSVPSPATFGSGTQDTKESCRKGRAQPYPAALEAIPHQMLISSSFVQAH